MTPGGSIKNHLVVSYKNWTDLLPLVIFESHLILRKRRVHDITFINEPMGWRNRGKVTLEHYPIVKMIDEEQTEKRSHFWFVLFDRFKYNAQFEKGKVEKDTPTTLTTC